MIGVVLVTHGGLGQALRDAMEHVVGRQPQFATVPVGPDDDMTAMRAEIGRRIREVDTGDGAVLLTDMFGGTPSNLAISMLEQGGLEVISGVNLPMLVKLAKARGDGTLDECVNFAQLAGRKYIAAASDLPTSCLGGSACVGLTQGRPVPVSGILHDAATRPMSHPVLATVGAACGASAGRDRGPDR